MGNSDFIGSGWSFPPQFVSAKQGPLMVNSEVEIKQALEILTSTTVGERVLHPDFGTGMADFMFESNSVSVLADLKEELSNIIIEYESRIDLLEIVINFDDIDNGSVMIDIQFIIRETNTRSNLVYPFYLRELAE